LRREFDEDIKPVLMKAAQKQHGMTRGMPSKILRRRLASLRKQVLASDQVVLKALTRTRSLMQTSMQMPPRPCVRHERHCTRRLRHLHRCV
jgi:hypothetical protein